MASSVAAEQAFHSTPREALFQFPVLIGDVGGTNARFAVIEGPDDDLGSVEIVRVADFLNIDDAITHALGKRRGDPPASMILAVAGPVTGDAIALTNCPWVVRPRALTETIGFRDIVMLNDFEAQALAAVVMGPENLTAIGVGTPEEGGGRVVLGPGTGLGVAGLIRSDGRWIPVRGEGGHMDLGPRTPRDFEIFPFLEKLDGRISGEQILCGRGLVNLYRAVAKADGAQAELHTPAEITTAALGGNDRLAEEVLDLFVSYLGRTAGDLALVFMSRGGVFLSGGIAQKIVPALQKPGFREAFEDKAPHQALMASMPVAVMTHPLAALLGLAAYARRPWEFGLETDGRRWRG
ncbi:MAG: glucokinase [Methylobacterium mesophilicum]|nr:glucokinase [Methylobacterium mesophilicum]